VIWHWDCLAVIVQSNSTLVEDDLSVRTLKLKSLLLVDDDEQLASALEWILADENFLVDTARDGEEALLKVTANEYDAVVCDLMMPRLRGDEFYLKARGIRPELSDRFIFITGFSADLSIKEFLTTNKANYLLKPFPIQGLINGVRGMLSSDRKR
jgi:two-component system response regulator ResD